MDFKVTGTRDGITAADGYQSGRTFEVLKSTCPGKAGRMHILNIATDTIAEPRPN